MKLIIETVVRDKLDIYVFIDVDDKGENVENRKKRYCDM